MSVALESLPDKTIEIFARSFVKEAENYGFNKIDYIRFVNVLLDLSMQKSYSGNKRHTLKETIEHPIEIKNIKQQLNLPIIGEDLIVRKYNPKSDLKIFKKWVDDKEGCQFLLSRDTAKTLDFNSLVINKNNIFGVITLRDYTPIGSVAYLNFDPDQCKAESRKLIGEPKMRGKGYAKRAMKMWIKYGFYALKLKKIYLNTLNTNIKNIKLNEDLGFKIEGILRNEVLFGGKYHDVIRMGLCDQKNIYSEPEN